MLGVGNLGDPAHDANIRTRLKEIEKMSKMLFLLTGIYLMFLRKRWQGIVVALFSLIAWIQPVFFLYVSSEGIYA